MWYFLEKEMGMRVIYYALLEKPRGSMRLTSCTLNENSDFIVFNEKTLRIEVQFLSPRSIAFMIIAVKLASKKIIFKKIPNIQNQHRIIVQR